MSTTKIGVCLMCLGYAIKYNMSFYILTLKPAAVNSAFHPHGSMKLGVRYWIIIESAYLCQLVLLVSHSLLFCNSSLYKFLTSWAFVANKKISVVDKIIPCGYLFQFFIIFYDQISHQGQLCLSS